MIDIKETKRYPLDFCLAEIQGNFYVIYYSAWNPSTPLKEEYPSSAIMVVPLIALASDRDMSQMTLAISSGKMMLRFWDQ